MGNRRVCCDCYRMRAQDWVPGSPNAPSDAFNAWHERLAGSSAGGDQRPAPQRAPVLAFRFNP